MAARRHPKAVPIETTQIEATPLAPRLYGLARPRSWLVPTVGEPCARLLRRERRRLGLTGRGASSSRAKCGGRPAVRIARRSSAGAVKARRRGARPRSRNAAQNNGNRRDSGPRCSAGIRTIPRAINADEPSRHMRSCDSYGSRMKQREAAYRRARRPPARLPAGRARTHRKMRPTHGERETWKAPRGDRDSGAVRVADGEEPCFPAARPSGRRGSGRRRPGYDRNRCEARAKRHGRPRRRSGRDAARIRRRRRPPPPDSAHSAVSGSCRSSPPDSFDASPSGDTSPPGRGATRGDDALLVRCARHRATTGTRRLRHMCCPER